MKTNRIIISMIFLLICCSSYSQLKVYSNGDIELKNGIYNGGVKAGIINYSGYSIAALYPTTANYAGLGSASNYFHIGYVHHLYSAAYDDWPSDGRLKENVMSLDGALDKINLLNPVKYDIKDSFYEDLTEEAKEQNIKISKGKLGFIAQELMEVFPELVNVEPITGYYSISTLEIVPVLVKAMQEQQATIKQLQENIKAIEQDCCNQSENLKSGSVESSETDIKFNETKLYQNNPNPFSEHTTIRFEIPKIVQNALLMICDMNGGLIKTIEVSQRGAGNVKINANEFNAGMYLYTLMTDSKEIATKRMILTQ